MITPEHAREIRAVMEERASTLTDEVALTVPEMFPKWTVRAYEMGERVRYDDILYKCVQAHPANSEWTPDVAVSLWARVLNDEIRDWVQPESTNPYMKGDKVRHNGYIWESDIDYNVYEPGVAGWHVVEG
jgi:chitodextrinase